MDSVIESMSNLTFLLLDLSGDSYKMSAIASVPAKPIKVTMIAIIIVTIR
jgi:hypothetical protein